MYFYPIFWILLISTFSKEPELPNHVVPLYGNASLGYYYANIYVGSPPQQQSVIVDTGSGQLALPCSKCQSCGTTHIHSPFKLSQSKTSKILTCNSQEEPCQYSCGGKSDSEACTFAISYAEGSSLSGIVIQDEIQFEGDMEGESIKTTFGCTTKETNLFYTQAANGIFGLAPMRQSKLFQKLHAKHSPKTGEQLIFSLCLSKNGGQLIVGKLRPEIHQNSKPVKTTYSRGQNLYSLDGVGEMRLGSKIIKSKNEFTGTFGVFIDSGATFTYLPRSNYNALSIALQNACAVYSNQCLVAKTKNNCFKIETDNSTILETVTKIFPSFEIQINNNVVLWSPADYFILRSLKSKQVCIGIEPLDRFILGGNWMVNRDIAFNLMQGTVQIFSNSRCQIQKSINSKILHQQSTSAQQISAQNVQDKIQSASKQQMIEYTGGMNQQQISYIDAIFREENSATIYLLILLCIIGGIIILLVMFSKILSQKQQRKQLKQEEHQTIKGVSKDEHHLNTSDELQKQSKSEEVHTEDIVVSEVK